ncbi:hypothetical protein HDU85_004057 [Gaertneriomyces sp. JEL0708]|nr:hypothetical protein HDU85_004057 [Gaertneriomyces sp. JEL0708]
MGNEPNGRKLNIKPPLPDGFNEANLLKLLETCPGFQDIFFYPHFYLLRFANTQNAANALKILREEPPRQLAVSWDSWVGKPDPENGPYPEASVENESNFLFVPRNFLKTNTLVSLVALAKGNPQWNSLTRGIVFRFRNTRDAWSALDLLTSKTNILPYFADKHGNPTYMDDLDNSEASENDPSCVLISPYGGEIQVLMTMLHSLPGFQRVYFEETDCFAAFSAPKYARYAMHYVQRNTKVQTLMCGVPLIPKLESALRADVDGPKSVRIVIDTVYAEKLKSRRSKKVYTAWLHAYQGFLDIPGVLSERYVVAQFDTHENATIALHDIKNTTNFNVNYDGMFMHPKYPITKDADYLLQPMLKITPAKLAKDIAAVFSGCKKIAPVDDGILITFNNETDMILAVTALKAAKALRNLPKVEMEVADKSLEDGEIEDYVIVDRFDGSLKDGVSEPPMTSKPATVEIDDTASTLKPLVGQPEPLTIKKDSMSDEKVLQGTKPDGDIDAEIAALNLRKRSQLIDNANFWINPHGIPRNQGRPAQGTESVQVHFPTAAEGAASSLSTIESSLLPIDKAL